MTTIPQRLRDIARSVHEMEYGQPGALADSLRAIAAKLEAPAVDAPKVVMLWRDHLPDGRYDPNAKDEPLIRQRDHIATVSALQQQLCTVARAAGEAESQAVATVNRLHAEAAALQASINELESDIKQLEADWSRLDWMQFHGAKVCWSNDGEVCDVQWSDRDGVYKTGLFIDWRAAIDAAIGGHFKEQP